MRSHGPEPIEAGVPGAPNALGAWRPHALARERHGLSVELLAFLVLTAIVAAALTTAFFCRSKDVSPRFENVASLEAVVERIMQVESNGDPNAKNKRSTATGSGQYLDATWLEMVRAHRTDLTRGRKEKELLALRRDPALTREITKRWVERNAAMLRKRGLPVTAGTLYLTYFAGPAGAVAVLTASEQLDAASSMASADASGRMTREKIVTANPFLATYTVGDLKRWADRKMHGL